MNIFVLCSYYNCQLIHQGDYENNFGCSKKNTLTELVSTYIVVHKSFETLYTDINTK